MQKKFLIIYAIIIIIALVAILFIIPDKEFLKDKEELLQEVFIVSGVEINEGKEFNVEVAIADGEKCERCWMYSKSVGADKKNPTICHKCSEALKD